MKRKDAPAAEANAGSKPEAQAAKRPKTDKVVADALKPKKNKAPSAKPKAKAANSAGGAAAAAAVKTAPAKKPKPALALSAVAQSAREQKQQDDAMRQRVMDVALSSGIARRIAGGAVVVWVLRPENLADSSFIRLKKLPVDMLRLAQLCYKRPDKSYELLVKTKEEPAGTKVKFLLKRFEFADEQAFAAAHSYCDERSLSLRAFQTRCEQIHPGSFVYLEPQVYLQQQLDGTIKAPVAAPASSSRPERNAHIIRLTET